MNNIESPEFSKPDNSNKTENLETNMNSITGFWTSVFQGDGPPTVTVTAADYSAMGSPLASLFSVVDNYFRITERGSTIQIEFWGGMTTFLAMCYIMALNGVIIAGPFNTGLSTNAVFFATTLTAGLFTGMMGFVVNLPVALAPGMGLNGYFASIAPACPANPTGDSKGTPCPGWGEYSLPWSDAMGAVFISGWFYLFFTFTGLRSMLFQAVPVSLRSAISCGIGMFITIIGLTIGQITRVTLAPWMLANIANANCFIAGSTVPFCYNSWDINFTGYSLGIVSFNKNPSARIAVLGLAIVAGLECLKVKGSIIISIILATVIGINYVHCTSLDTGNKCVTDLTYWGQKGGPNFVVDISDIPSGKLTFNYINKPFFWECVWSFLFVELFDSFGTLTGIMQRCGFMDGDVSRVMSRVNRAMCVDGFSLWMGGLIGANSCTIYVESTTGVEAGARTGLASVFTGGAFLLSLAFIFPFVQIVPDAATTSALVMVGVHCLSCVRDIDFSDNIYQLSAFFIIATMGFTYSIANGICAGFIFFSWMRVVRWVQLHVSKALGAPTWGPKEGLETDLPHPLMIIMACFMSVRFSYLKA